MAVRRPAIIAAMTTLPDASANARCSWASRARNSAGVRSAASIASSTRVGIVGGAAGVGGERLDDGATRARAGCSRRRRAGKPLAATCSRSSADMPPRGRGDDDGAGCRTRAGAGADESHHLEHPQRLTDARAADAERWPRARARGGSRSPGARRPSSRSASMRSSTVRHARAGGVVVSSMRPPRVV